MAKAASQVLDVSAPNFKWVEFKIEGSGSGRILHVGNDEQDLRSAIGRLGEEHLSAIKSSN